MFWITSAHGISNMPKRNIILESIGGMLIGEFELCLLLLLTNILCNFISSQE